MWVEFWEIPNPFRPGKYTRGGGYADDQILKPYSTRPRESAGVRPLRTSVFDWATGIPCYLEKPMEFRTRAFPDLTMVPGVCSLGSREFTIPPFSRFNVLLKFVLHLLIQLQLILNFGCLFFQSE
jgi:hypothetical protein